MVTVGYLGILVQVARLLVGAAIRWEDKNPLSNDAEERLLFSFDSKTSKTTDVLLQRYGLADISQIVNLKGRWRVGMTLVFKCPNHPKGYDRYERYPFELTGTIFPMMGKFAEERDRFYLMQMIENNQIPTDKKSFGIYQKTIFEAELIGV